MPGAQFWALADDASGLRRHQQRFAEPIGAGVNPETVSGSDTRGRVGSGRVGLAYMRVSAVLVDSPLSLAVLCGNDTSGHTGMD